MRILIAEDDFTCRQVLTAVLEKYGHEVVATEDGDQAWAAMQRPDAPQLAILDWMMPGIDGLEVCRRIRTLPGESPPYVIMLTTLGDKGHVVAGLEAGADDYVAKPFDADELRARIAVGVRVVTLQQRLAEQATTDGLTGLLNRRAGLEMLSKELSRSSREGGPVGLGMIDIDYFKRINDGYGHLAGDDVLRELGERLRDSLRPYDYLCSFDQLCRYGGEEFLIVAPGCGPGEALWERLRRLVADRPFPTCAGELEVTVSIGFTSGDGRSSAETLINAADQALYRAKERGRNRVEQGVIEVALPLPRVACAE